MGRVVEFTRNRAARRPPQEHHTRPRRRWMPAIKAWSLWALRKLWRGFRWAVVFTLILIEKPVTFLLGALAVLVAPVLEWVAWIQPVDDPWRIPYLIGIPIAALISLAVGAFYRELVGRIIPADDG